MEEALRGRAQEGDVAMKKDRGAAAVEFAFVVIFLVGILAGVIEGGRLWYIQASLSQAAREGAREMAIHNVRGTAEGLIESRASGLGVEVSGRILVNESGDLECESGRTVQARVVASVDSVTGLFGVVFPEDGLPMTGKADMRCGG